MQIRNLGIIAHVDAGKTTLTERILHLAGVTRSIGRVDDGTARTDFLGVEKRRGISVRAAAVSFEFSGVRINLIDTPGHADFTAEVERSLRVLDGVILVVSAVEGIEAQTEILFTAARRMRLPTIVFINKLDRMGADAAAVLADLQERWPDIAFVEPASSDAQTQIAELDDDLTERYIVGDPIAADELDFVLRCAVHRGDAVPVYTGSALHGNGVAELLAAAINYLPNPEDRSGSAFSALVFRVEHGGAMGRQAYVRLYGGSLKNRDVVYNQTRGIQNRVSQIKSPKAIRGLDVGQAVCGDIAILCGAGEMRIGDVLGDGTGLPPEYHLSEPLLRVRVEPSLPETWPTLLKALRELEEEDPMLHLDLYSPGQSALSVGGSGDHTAHQAELHISLMGSVQQESIEALLNERYGLTPQFGPPTVIFKETPAGSGVGSESYTWPKPCWAVVRFLIEPLPRGAGFVYDSGSVRDDRMFYRYQEHVRRAVPDALKQGLFGWEVTDLKVTLLDGQHHTIHTHPLDFFVATPIAIRTGLRSCGTTLLEPILKVHIVAPPEYAGRVTQDLSARRGILIESSSSHSRCHLEGILPVLSSLDYTSWLGINTRGQASLSVSFAGYQPCPVGLEHSTPFRGVDPLDRSKFILASRQALEG